MRDSHLSLNLGATASGGGQGWPLFAPFSRHFSIVSASRAERKRIQSKETPKEVARAGRTHVALEIGGKNKRAWAGLGLALEEVSHTVTEH